MRSELRLLLFFALRKNYSISNRKEGTSMIYILLIDVAIVLLAVSNDVVNWALDKIGV